MEVFHIRVCVCVFILENWIQIFGLLLNAICILGCVVHIANLRQNELNEI